MKTLKLKLLSISVLALFWITAKSQNVGITDDGSSFTPDSTSVLELKSTSKGLLIPRMTYAQRIAISSPAQGLMIYQTDDQDEGTGFYYNSSSTSTANWVYVANTSKSERSNHVLVKSLSDFPTPVSNVITLEDNISYEINGTINLGSNSIQMGTSNTIYGVDQSDDKLVYTGTGSMILANNEDFSIRELLIYAPTSGSKVFDISGSTNKVHIADVIFGSCNNLGTFNGGDMVILDRNLITGCSNGFELKGSLEHIFLVENICEDNTGTIISIPSGNFNSILIQSNYYNISLGSYGLQIDASSITVEDAKIVQNFFINDGTYISGVSTNYAEWFFYGNTELEDSNPFGWLIFLNNTTATSIASKNVYYKVAGSNYDSKVECFDTNGVNNRLRYTGTKTLSGQIKCSGNVQATQSGKHVRIAIYKNGTTQVALTQVKPADTTNGFSFYLSGEIELTTNDYLEVYVATQTSAFDVTITELDFKIDD